jgi:hypothetical protein
MNISFAALNVRFRGQSGHGLRLARCLLMTDAVEKVLVDIGES